MRIATVFPNEAPRADYSDIAAVSQRLLEASDELGRMVDAVAKAMTVREFCGDRRKRSLALSTREHSLPGSNISHTAAETLGRASVRYGEDLEAQASQLEEAERVIARRDAVRAQWESARSVLSSLKSIAGNV